jgi:hypothetical protein
MSFLFRSEQQKLVDEATSDLHISPDWGLNLALQEEIRRAPDGGKEYLKAMLKRLGHKNPQVVLLTLELLASCFQNVVRFRALVHHQDALNELVRVAKNNKLPGDVRDKALEMIMVWGEGFAQVREFPNFAATYQRLKHEGLSFPAKDMAASPPLFTPEAHPKPEAKERHPLTWISPEYTQKLKKDLQLVVSTVKAARQLLGSVQDVRADQSLQAHLATLREMQKRLTPLIVELTSELLVDLCIQINDHISSAFEWYEARVRGGEYQVRELPYPKALYDESGGEVDDAGAAGNGAGAAPSAGAAPAAAAAAAAAPAAPAKKGEDDEFDALASRKKPERQLEDELEELARGAPPAGAGAAAAPDLDELLGLGGAPAAQQAAKPQKDPKILEDL